MRLSRLGVVAILAATVLLGANCGYYNKVFARKDLVDGSEAYKNRKFKEAEELFRAAVARDPKGDTLEGKMAQLFLARTLHSQYIGNRNMTFGESDFLGENQLGMAEKVMSQADPLSKYIFEQLAPETKNIYSNYQSMDPGGSDFDGIKRKNEIRKSFLSAFGSDLNKMINAGQSIYDPARFAKVTLSDFTKRFMEGQPTGDKLVRLNRLLLEDAYPQDLARKPKAEDAITEYQKALDVNIADQSSYKAIASLYENLQRNDDWLALVTARSNNANIPPEQRAEALTSLAAKKNSCANDITDTEATKKTVTKDGKQAFQFVKPESTEDFEKLKQCIDEGMQLIDKALALETPQVKNAASFDVKPPVADADLVKMQDHLKVFESARSYKASLLIQSMRLAEMDGRTADRDRLKTESEAARQQYLALSDVVKKIQAEIDERKAATDEATKANANAANMPKK